MLIYFTHQPCIILGFIRFKRLCELEEFEDTKEVIRICKSKKDRQHNGQKKRTKGQQNKDRAIRTPLKQDMNSGAVCCYFEILSVFNAKFYNYI